MRDDNRAHQRRRCARQRAELKRAPAGQIRACTFETHARIHAQASTRLSSLLKGRRERRERKHPPELASALLLAQRNPQIHTSVCHSTCLVRASDELSAPASASFMCARAQPIVYGETRTWTHTATQPRPPPPAEKNTHTTPTKKAAPHFFLPCSCTFGMDKFDGRALPACGRPAERRAGSTAPSSSAAFFLMSKPS